MKNNRASGDEYFDRMVTRLLVERDEVSKKMHTPSGKLSASTLGNPTQWQILKMIGVPATPMEPYVLRKFLRGFQVEKQAIEWLDQIGCAREKQKPVEYKGAVGYVDITVDMTAWDTIGLGIIPHEIKSVTNAKFSKLRSGGEADHWHRLQATMYALAMGTEYYVINYISGEDYRIMNFLYSTLDTAQDVEDIITTFNKYKNEHKVPMFESRYPWQSNQDFNNYPEWSKLTEAEIEDKLKEEFPDAYKRLQL